MKTRNVSLENSPLLTNNIVKQILLEAPTISELQKKVKEFELILVRAITNAYQLYELTLDKKPEYSILPTGSYQVALIMSFSGKKKDSVTNPEKTLQYLKHLTALESKKDKETNSMRPRNIKTREIDCLKTIEIDVNQRNKEDEIVSNEQRTFLEQFISNTDLSSITFSVISKSKDYNTGKIRITMQVNYKIRELQQQKAQHQEPEGQEQ